MPIQWKLAAMLEKRGMSAYQLALLMGVKPATIYRLAKRTTLTRITGDTLDELCRHLRCTPGQLLARAPERSGD